MAETTDRKELEPFGQEVLPIEPPDNGSNPESLNGRVLSTNEPHMVVRIAEQSEPGDSRIAAPAADISLAEQELARLLATKTHSLTNTKLLIIILLK